MIDMTGPVIPKVKKKAAKKFKNEIIVVCGSTKWDDKKKMKAVLSKHNPIDVRYVVTGTSKGADLMAVSVAKELKMHVVQVHPDQSLGQLAIKIRNEGVINFFKPSVVLAFHKNIEQSIGSALYLKLATKKDIPHLLFDGKIPAKKKVSK